MFLERYLTEYDESLSGESYIDPIGTLVIWSAYGQEIFRNRVNSIANDVRNYTINLFNHHVIRRLIRDETALLSNKLTNVYGGKDTLFFKYACLLYLENLFVFSILKHEDRKGIDSSGVLGITKGRRLWAEKDINLRLVFSHEKPGQILVRQLGLGVSGRYKTPLMEIGYFDANYHYYQPRAAALWKDVDQFVAATPLGALADALTDHLRVLLSQNKEKPETAFGDLPETLSKTLVDTFASPVVVGKYAKNYWLSATGLDTGAAGALLAVMDENAHSAKPKDLGARKLITLALAKPLPEEERLKMEHIQQLEPFLADTMLLFSLLTAKKSQPLKSVMVRWEAFGRDEQTLPLSAWRLRDNLKLIAVVKGTARTRLNSLLRLADAPTLADQIGVLLDYHGKVMTERGQSPWLTVQEEGLVRVHVRPMRTPLEEDWSNGTWYNSYYLPQFKWLVSGYQGVAA